MNALKWLWNLILLLINGNGIGPVIPTIVRTFEEIQPDGSVLHINVWSGGV